MVKCPHCGKKLREDEMFCRNCENDVSEIKNEREKPGHESHEH